MIDVLRLNGLTYRFLHLSKLTAPKEQNFEATWQIFRPKSRICEPLRKRSSDF